MLLLLVEGELSVEHGKFLTTSVNQLMKVTILLQYLESFFHCIDVGLFLNPLHVYVLDVDIL